MKPLPNVLFKFMSSAYVDRFISGESVRLGTLSDFRKTEIHALNKGDLTEGILNVKGTTPWNTNQFSFQKVVQAIEKTGMSLNNVSFGGNSVADIRFQYPECFIFSASHKFDPNIAADLDQNYDVCIRIGNPKAFALNLVLGCARKLAKNDLHVSWDYVDYKTKLVRPDEESFENDPFFKDIAFQNQREFRFAIKADALSKPINISVDMAVADASVCWSR